MSMINNNQLLFKSTLATGQHQHLLDRWFRDKMKQDTM